MRKKLKPSTVALDSFFRLHNGEVLRVDGSDLEYFFNTDYGPHPIVEFAGGERMFLKDIAFFLAHGHFPSDRSDVEHKDGNPLNNHVSNLHRRWL